jgi:hypothetical protein
LDVRERAADYLSCGRGLFRVNELKRRICPTQALALVGNDVGRGAFGSARRGYGDRAAGRSGAVCERVDGIRPDSRRKLSRVRTSNGG